MNFLTATNVIHVEVALLTRAELLDNVTEKIEDQLKTYMQNNRVTLNKQHIITREIVEQYEELKSVKAFLVESEGMDADATIKSNDLHRMIFHYYMPDHHEMEYEMLDNETDGCGGDSGGQVPSYSHWLMPSKDLMGLWENLIYEDNVKEKLLRFALSALTFSQHNVDKNIICCNRMILLHGPPGTGKTSLCKALTQKLAIRMSKTFTHTHLIEINSHSLFSKWFSESGKLVLRLFANIRELLQSPRVLVCVLIDEVESLAYARDAMSSREPKDAMRVVNALLTQLDAIKEATNVLILATSNLVEGIDMAFLDRADIKQYIDLPSKNAIRRIYESMLHELMRTGIVQRESLENDDQHEGLLNELAERSVGYSGRTLRKLPFLALAEHTLSDHFSTHDKVHLSDFLDAMMIALEKHKNDHHLMRKKTEETY